MRNYDMFDEVKEYSIKGDYKKAREILDKCLEEEKDDIYLNIHLSLLEIIRGNITGAKEIIEKCMEKDKNATKDYLKTLDNTGKKISNMCITSEFRAFMGGLETLYYITN